MIAIRTYLDNNVYRALEADWRNARKLFRAAGIEVVVGDSNLAELLQIPRQAARRAGLECICGVRDHWTAGAPGWSMAREGYLLLRRTHPDWIRGKARRKVVKDMEDRRGQALGLLCSHPEQLDLWSQNLAAPFHAHAEGVRGWQKESVAVLKGESYRDAMQKRLPDVTLPDLEPWELQWRLLGAERFYNVTNGRYKEEVDYLIDVEPGHSHEEWAELWLALATIVAAPATALHGIVRYYQLFSSLKGTGNMIDATHVVHALGCNRFVTCDERLAGTLRRAREHIDERVPLGIWIPFGDCTPERLVAALQAA